MSRLRLVLRLTTHLAAASALVLAVGGSAHAATIMINNGLAPPNPENVIDAADDYSGDEVYVRNVGCPPGWPAVFPYDPCPSPGAATEVEVASGGQVGGSGDWVYLSDSSTITVNGGTVGALVAQDSSTVTTNGGTVSADLRDSSTELAPVS